MPPKSGNEIDRLASLRDLDILDTEPEAEFESIVKAAAALCGTPMSLISLVDENRQWFKANVGLPGVSETPRSMAFCARTILQDDILEVDDCTTDERFLDNPLVTGSPELRFYAGVPLCLSDGSHVGSLCVLDQKPGKLTESQRIVLTHLSEAAVHAMESRRTARQQIINESRFRTLCSSLSLGVFATDAKGELTFANDRLSQILGASDDQGDADSPDREVYLRRIIPNDRALFDNYWKECNENGTGFELDVHVRKNDGSVTTARILSNPVIADDGAIIGRVGSVEDITLANAHLAEQFRSMAMLRQTGALAKVGGWEVDMVDDQLTWSEQTCLIHALPTDHQPAVASALSFYTPESRDRVIAAMDRLTSTGAGFDLELQLNRADGECIWVRVVGEGDVQDGQMVRLRGAIQDIDEAVCQRLAMENAHERVTLATQSGEIGVWEWDLADNRVSWTPEMLELYGLPQSESVALLENWKDLLHPDDRQRSEVKLEEALTGGGDYEDEFRIVQPDGTVCHIQSRAHIRRDADGKPIKLMGVNLDVSPLRRLATELAEQRELLQVTLQSIDDAVITADTEGRITWMNPSAERLTQWTCAESVGQPLNRVYKVEQESSGRHLESPVAECLRLARPVQQKNDIVLVARDGSHVGIEDSASPIMDNQRNLLGVVLVFRDVAEQRRLTTEMSHRATHDDLTQVYNRSEFEVRLQQFLDSRVTAPASHALMFIDLDQFKIVNDACGHSVGDQLLRQIADILMGSLREGDILARLGGDEFGVILKNCSAEDARVSAQKICNNVDGFRFSHNSRRFRIGASIGLVPLDERWSSVSSIMQAADTSCYAAKEAGRNRVHVWFDTDQTMRARRGDMQWAARLEQSLDENRFELFAQRLVPLDGSQRGLEAEVLIRLRDDSGDIILPTTFLAAAERFHLATRIDRWVLQKSIDTLVACPSLEDVDRLWINLSGQSVGDREFHREAIQMLMEVGPEIRRRLCLEITETAAVTNITDAARFIDRLRTLGLTTALDDFGAGASSFGYLKSLPVDVLKIDGQFISNLTLDALDEAAVRCFVDVAGIIGLKTVAEHVDCPEVLERVKALGVDYAQGFLLHEPESLSQVLRAAGGQGRGREAG